MELHKRTISKYFRILSALICFGLSGHLIYAQKPVIITDSIEDIRIPLAQFRVLEDRTGLSFKAVSAPSFQQFLPEYSPDQVFKLNKYYWIKFTVLNQSEEDKRWYMQLPLHTEKASIYILMPDGTYHEYNTGQQTDFESRPIHLRTLVFELPMYKNKPVDVYMHVISRKHYDSSVVISSPSRYLEVHTNGYILLGLIYGILFLMVVYNFVLYLSIKDKIYLYYIFYTLSSAFFISWKDGLGFEFIWSHLPSINTYHHSTGLFLLLMAFMLYTVNFLELGQRHPDALKITNGFIVVDLLYFVYNIIDPGFFNPLPIVYLVSYIWLFGLALYYTVKNYKPAGYLLISIIAILAALLVLKLRYMGLIKWSWFIEYILNYAVVVDAIVMSLGIRGKLVYLREENEKMVEQQLREERLRVESELVQQRNQHLEAEIVYQNNELSMLATNLAQNNELFTNLKKELLTASKEGSSGSSLNRIIKEIEKGSEADNNWEQFQLNFDKAHNNFLTRLRERFPLLKPTDLLFCAYLKLNKSNKEIASLLNMSTSAVEKRRFRLREKMELENNTTLSDFLLNFK